MECLKRYSAKSCFVLTRGVGWKLLTFATHYTTYRFVLFPPRDPSSPSSGPRAPSSPLPCVNSTVAAALPSAGRTAGDAGDEPSAAHSASPSQFLTLRWPFPSSSSNPRRLGCQWRGGRRRRGGKRGSWRCLGGLIRSVFTRIWRGGRPWRRRGRRPSHSRSRRLGQGHVRRCARRSRWNGQGRRRPRPGQGRDRRPD
jgi:hypothetical protein